MSLTIDELDQIITPAKMFPGGVSLHYRSNPEQYGSAYIGYVRAVVSRSIADDLISRTAGFDLGEITDWLATGRCYLVESEWIGDHSAAILARVSGRCTWDC